MCVPRLFKFILHTYSRQHFFFLFTIHNRRSPFIIYKNFRVCEAFYICIHPPNVKKLTMSFFMLAISFFICALKYFLQVLKFFFRFDHKIYFLLNIHKRLLAMKWFKIFSYLSRLFFFFFLMKKKIFIYLF